MLVLFSDKQDENVSILAKKLLKRKIVKFKWITPDYVQSVYNDYTGYTYIKLIDGSIIETLNNFFINRVPELPLNHPLITFLYLIPYDKVLTHPNTAAILQSKLSQLKYFKLIPETVILKNIDTFSQSNTCVKSISQIRSFVRDSKDSVFADRNWQYVPVQFQELLLGIHIKSHVIGDDIYTYRFVSDTLDPREDDYKIYKHNTTKIIKKHLLDISSKIGVNYFDCDMIINDKNIFFLEINSSPAPMVFAKESKDNRLSKRFVDFLICEEYKVKI